MQMWATTRLDLTLHDSTRVRVRVGTGPPPSPGALQTLPNARYSKMRLQVHTLTMI